MAKQREVAEVALRVVQARRQGLTTFRAGGHEFDLDDGGYCARFVRQCCEVAAGLPEWGFPFAAPDAREMEKKLLLHEKGVPNLQPGDIIACNNQAYKHGHIVLYVGDGQIAENTSSGSRGDPRKPGTKVSPMAAVAATISGYYRVYEGEAELKFVVYPIEGEWVVPDCNPRIENGVLRVDARAAFEAAGFDVTDHIPDQGKVYAAPRLT